MAHVSLLVEPDGRVRIRPNGYLGHERFTTFREAVRDGGGYYSTAKRASLCDRGVARDVARALQRHGFDVELDIVLGTIDGSPSAPTPRAAITGLQRAQIAAAQAEAAGHRLYPYQIGGVQWLAENDAALIGDDPGLGKTVQIIGALPEQAAVVIVCPAFLKLNWQIEFERWRPEIRPTVLKGRNSFRWPQPGEAVILNYEILPKLVKEGKKQVFDPAHGPAPAGSILAVDECHAAKDPSRQRSKRLRHLAQMVRRAGGKTWGATGTPIKNYPADLWGVLYAFGLEMRAFNSYPEFLRLFAATEKHFGRRKTLEYGTPHPSVPDRLSRVMLRRIKADVLPELPPKTYQTLLVDEIDESTITLCDEALRLLQDAGVELTAATLSADLRTDARIFSKLSAAMSALAAAKIPAAVQLAEQYEASEIPLVAFSQYRAPVEVLATRPGWDLVAGGVKATDKQAAVEQFQNGQLRGLALTIGAGGTGLTLTRASHLMRVSRAWTPSENQQCEDRIHRISQQATSVHIIDVVANHELDRKLTEALLFKQAIADASLPVHAPPL